MSPKEHILSIRSKLTGENSSINSDGRLVVDNLIQKLTRAISELATNIYKKDSHFVMELIQNADDNNYKFGVIPTLRISQSDDKIIFKNNEIGFNADNIDSICDISKSTKSVKKGIKGYIGEKGIGFKSVFRVSDEPEIYSNGYQFKFDSHTTFGKKQRQIKLGFILPQWIDHPDSNIDESFTNIVLPFKESLSYEEKCRLSDLDPDLIIFLNKLLRLEITNGSNGVKTVVSKSRKDNLVTIKQESHRLYEEPEIKKKIYKVFEKEIKVPKSFDIPQRKGVTSTKIILAFPLVNKSTLKYDEEQKVFSFLPIIKSGFRFIIQADLILTSGRESIDEDNDWNRWIREEIFTTFKLAIEDFKKYEDYKYNFINYFPTNKESFSEFFQPLAEQMIYFSQHAKIVLSESGKWISPEQIVYASPEQKKIFDNTLFKRANHKDYLNKNYEVNEELFQTLNIDNFSDYYMLECLKISGEIKKDHLWYVDLFVFLSMRNDSSTLTSSIQKFKIIPIQTIATRRFQLACPKDENIFFPIEKTLTYSFEKSVRIVSKDFYFKISLLQKHRKKVLDYLVGLGIKEPKPYFIIKNYILQKYHSDEWKLYSKEELSSHLLYIKHHWSELKKNHDDILKVVANKPIIKCNDIGDGKTYYSSTSNLYISADYGNKNQIEKLFHGVKDIWLTNDHYIKIDIKYTRNGKKTKLQIVKEWYNFLKTLGCREIPSCSDNNSEEDVLKILDSGKPDKINEFFLLLEKKWSEFKRHIYLTNRVKKRWFKKLTEERTIPIGSSLYFAKDVYIKKKQIKELFGDTVKYFPRDISDDFATTFGFETTINSESIIKYLTEKSKKNIKLPKEKILRLYNHVFSDEEADWGKFQKEKLIYLNDKAKWYSIDEVFWTDYSYLFREKFGYCEKNFPRKWKDIFIDGLGVKEIPQVTQYVQLLEEFSSKVPDPGLDKNDKETIYKIYKALGELYIRSDEDKDDFLELDGHILTNRGDFWRNEDDLFYNDNDRLYELFKNEEGIAFFDIPVNILPITKPLLGGLNISSISSKVTQEMKGEISLQLNERITKRVRKYSQAIISVLYTEHPEFYELNRNTSLFESLRKIEIYECPELIIEYSLKEIKKTDHAYSFHKENRIYISRDNGNDFATLAYEISSMLHSHHLLEFLLLVLTLPKSSLNFLIKQKNITPPPDEIVPTDKTEYIDDSEIEVNESDELEYDNLDSDYNQHKQKDSMLSENEKNSFRENGDAILWTPELPVDDVLVEIENYPGYAYNEDYEDKEGRVISKSKNESSDFENEKSPKLSAVNRERIGDYGEEKVFLHLIKILKNKYSDYEFVSDERGFRVWKDDRLIAELKWLNSSTHIKEGYDITLSENGQTEYFEVKTSRGNEKVVFSVTSQQWKFIRDKSDKYNIMRVINADKENVRILKINDPYRLWIEGKLQAYPINIELY